MSISITLNGQEKMIDDKTTVLDILREQGGTRRVAVYVNGEQWLQSDYDIRYFSSGDQVKIIRIFSGG
jgi:thiamine biosynthesis protein ThiS